MNEAKAGLAGNWLFEKESVLIFISQYTLQFHSDQRVKHAKTKKSQRGVEGNRTCHFPEW